MSKLSLTREDALASAIVYYTVDTIDELLELRQSLIRQLPKHPKTERTIRKRRELESRIEEFSSRIAKWKKRLAVFEQMFNDGEL